MGLVFLLLFQKKYAERNIPSYPAFFTTLGILGTFLGISYGLWFFDPSNVEKSFPALLSGLKTAFWASLLGISFALIFKVRDIYANSHKKVGEAGTQVTIRDLLLALNSIQVSLAGREDSSLISQMKLMRQDQSDQLGQLRISMDTFMKGMAEHGSETLVEALKNLIQDFDSKINAQLGESFHQLNDALGKVLVWQEAYQGQMAGMLELQKEATALLAPISEGFVALSERSMDTKNVLDALKGAIEQINRDRVAMESSMRDFGQLLSKAGEGFPQVERKIIELATQMEKGVEYTTKMLGDTIEASTKRAEAQIIILDKAMEAELTRALSGLGQQLTALSQKFVEDYTPLTERLRDLVQSLGEVRK
jgi:hypothetical protein